MYVMSKYRLLSKGMFPDDDWYSTSAKESIPLLILSWRECKIENSVRECTVQYMSEVERFGSRDE